MDNKKGGYYFGTEIDEKWWKRYKKGKMFARGLGKYWFDDSGLYFLRALTRKPMFISYASMLKVKTGKWHSGKWGQGYTILKIVWTEDKKRLSSGFILSKGKVDVMNIKDFLENKIKEFKVRGDV